MNISSDRERVARMQMPELTPYMWGEFVVGSCPFDAESEGHRFLSR